MSQLKCGGIGAGIRHGPAAQKAEARHLGNRIDLEGRCAVVTGGAQGFGKAIAERFVASGAGVALWDRDLPLAEATAKALGPAVVAIGCDVADPAAVADARDATVKRLGR